MCSTPIKYAKVKGAEGGSCAARRGARRHLRTYFSSLINTRGNFSRTASKDCAKGRSRIRDFREILMVRVSCRGKEAQRAHTPNEILNTLRPKFLRSFFTLCIYNPRTSEKFDAIHINNLLI